MGYYFFKREKAQTCVVFKEITISKQIRYSKKCKINYHFYICGGYTHDLSVASYLNFRDIPKQLLQTTLSYILRLELSSSKWLWPLA